MELPRDPFLKLASRKDMVYSNEEVGMKQAVLLAQPIQN